MWPHSVTHPLAHTRINRNRAHNVDTPRLLARRDVLVNILTFGARDFESRAAFAVKAAEMMSIERVLIERGVIHPRAAYSTQ